MEELNDSQYRDDDTPPDDKSNETVKGRFIIQEINEEDFYFETIKSSGERRTTSFDMNKKIKHRLIEGDFPYLFDNRCYVYDESSNSYEDLSRIFSLVENKTLSAKLKMETVDKIPMKTTRAKEAKKFLLSSNPKNFALNFRKEEPIRVESQSDSPALKDEYMTVSPDNGCDTESTSNTNYMVIQSESSFTLEQKEIKETYRNICHNCIKNIQFKI